MKLVETLREVGLPEEEKLRISSALSDDSSNQYRVFSDYYKGQKLFDDICHKMTKTITGFRPTAKAFRKRVHSEILKGLRKNKAKLDFWHLYQTCVADFVISNHSALNQLLGDTEVPDGFTPTTENIISAITERAAEYSVHDRDVGALYDLWPFERIPNIRDYLSKCPKFDRFRALDESIRSVEGRLAREISDLKQHSTDDVAEIRIELQTKVATKTELKEATQANKQHADQSVGSLTERLGELENERSRIQKLARRFEAKRAAEQQESEVERAKELEKLNQAINQLKNEQTRISEVVEKLPLGGPQHAVSLAPNAEAKRSPFSILEHASSTEDLEKLSVKDALRQFVALTKKGESGSPGHEEIFFYTALLANCMLVVNQTQLNIWHSVVGWSRRKITACASPLWVDEYAIAEQLFWLFDEPEEPRCLEVLDFDLGYVEGYLGPFLRAWSQSGLQLPWKKILLVPSGDTWSLPGPGRIHDQIAVLPKIDFDSSVSSKNANREFSTVPPFRVRKFLKKHEIDNRIDAVGTMEAGESAETFVQAKFVNSLPLPKEATRKFAAELVDFWDNKRNQ